MRILVSRFIWFVPITGLCRAINISVLMGLVAFAITQTHSMPLWQIRFCCAFLFIKWFTNCRYWWFIILNSFNLVRGSHPAQMYIGQSRAFSDLFFGSVCYRNDIEAILLLKWLLGYSSVDSGSLTALVTGAIVGFLGKTVSFAGELPNLTKRTTQQHKLGQRYGKCKSHPERSISSMTPF